MALTNPNTGEYLKITGMQFDFAHGNHHINYLLFANAEQRQRYETGLSPYEVFQNGQYNNFGVIEAELNDYIQHKVVGEALLNAMYRALKSEVFVEYIDC